MKIAKFGGAVLTAIIVLTGIISLHSGMSLPMPSYIISSSGSISYGGKITRQLHTEGKYVKDDLGNIVYLRGVNRPSGFTASCTGNWFEDGDWIWGAAYTGWTETGLRQRLQQMQDAGFNVIRLIMFAEWWINDASTNLGGQTTDVSFRYAMKETIRVAQEYGIYIVIVPWASDQGAQQEMPFPSNSIPNAQAFADFWASVATELKSYPNVLFELYNEPVGDYATWFNAVELAVNAIRQITDHIIIVQYGYCGDFSWVPSEHASWGASAGNILYSNHIYRWPWGATIDPSIYTYDGVRDVLLNNWGYDVVINDYPAWIGEIGPYTAASEQEYHETTWWRNVLQLLNDWEMGYAAWEWDQPGAGWDLQEPIGVAPYQPNERGRILIDMVGGTY